jgi:hypothetical protein
MNRALAVASLLFVGCASARTEAVHSSVALELPAVSAREAPVEPLAAEAPAPTSMSLEPTERTSFSFEPTFMPLPTAPPAADDLRTSRFTLKAGYYSSEEDALDDGWILNLSWMRFFTHFFALEFEAGYFDASGGDGTVSTDAWGIPLMVNARLNLPVWVLDLYGGAGLGTIYYDISAGSYSDDGFLLAGNAFLGATVNLADSIALGLEAKYYMTEDIGDTGNGLDALALMLTVGFSR